MSKVTIVLCPDRFLGSLSGVRDVVSRVMLETTKYVTSVHDLGYPLISLEVKGNPFNHQ